MWWGTEWMKSGDRSWGRTQQHIHFLRTKLHISWFISRESELAPFPWVKACTMLTAHTLSNWFDGNYTNLHISKRTSLKGIMKHQNMFLLSSLLCCVRCPQALWNSKVCTWNIPGKIINMHRTQNTAEIVACWIHAEGIVNHSSSDWWTAHELNISSI